MMICGSKRSRVSGQSGNPALFFLKPFYSTVTDFARFLGLSTSSPFATLT